MTVDRTVVREIEEGLEPETRERVAEAARAVVRAKERGGSVVAVVGSGPNLHEGVTTLLAELMHKGLVDGVSTSSAVVNHEMGGSLERVKRIDGRALGLPPGSLPLDGMFEVSLLSDEALAALHAEIPVDPDLYRRMRTLEGPTIIKAAGNMAYPTGLRTERVARDVLALARKRGLPFEQVAGRGADPMTMLGAGAARALPVLVTVPQLVGGGEVGMAVGDSIPVSNRCRRIAELLAGADVIVESALALSQEIHDGPFDTYTGHGVWADWEGGWTFSLEKKAVVRIDLDPNLDRAWQEERTVRGVSRAVQEGLPKSKTMGMPFRMEMSGFARLPGSLPVVGDIGEIWPVLALKAADALDVKLDFICCPQSLPAGAEMREWIVEHVRPLDRARMYAWDRSLGADEDPCVRHDRRLDSSTQSR
jgi:hypothetical protein